MTQKPVVRPATVNRPPRTGSRATPGSLSIITIHKRPPSIHSVLMPPNPGPPLRCRPVSPTPIYDQLRGERINADVPATGAEPSQVDHPGKHRLPGGAPSAAAVSVRTSGAGADRAASWSWFAPTGAEPSAAVDATCRAEPAREAVAGWGPQAALPQTAHARQEQAQASRRSAMVYDSTSETSSA